MLSPETRTAIVPEGGIERIAGEDRIATAIAASRRAFPEGAEAIVLATARDFPDALTSAAIAYRGEGPLLLVGDRLDDAVADEIDRLGATRIHVPGGVAAVPYVVQVALEERGLEVIRTAGENRFDTASLIAQDLGVGAGGEVAVATARTFADALSFASLAAAGQIPIVLVDGERLTGDARAAILELDPARTLVLGGPAAVSDGVLEDLPEPVRYAGADRYGTAVAIADLLLERGGVADTIYVATGRTFPDALAAGPIAALGPGPLLLVEGRDAAAADATWEWLERRADDVDGIIVFGGPVAVDEEVADRLRPYAEEEGS